MGIRTRAAAVALATLLLSACATGTAAPAPSSTRPSAEPSAASSAPPSGAVPPSGAAPPSSPAQAASGITGTATIDGGCPVARAEPPCPDRPLRARLEVTRTDTGATVTATETDADGHFTIPLPPGRYEVRPTSLTGGKLPRAQPVAVVVEPGRYATVSVRFDSGIR